MALRRSPELSVYQYQQPIINQTTTTPPGSPVDGDRYIVGPAATGSWTGQDGKIAWYFNAAWQFDTPSEGWMVWDNTVNAWYQHNGTAWELFRAGQLSDGTNTVTAAQAKESYDREASYNSSLKAIVFQLP